MYVGVLLQLFNQINCSSKLFNPALVQRANQVYLQLVPQALL
jgi:hypothetical protein